MTKSLLPLTVDIELQEDINTNVQSFLTSKQAKVLRTTLKEHGDAVVRKLRVQLEFLCREKDHDT